jgi:hypothetical protein
MFPDYGYIPGVGDPRFRPLVHRNLSHGPHVDVTGSKSSNDREAQASQRNDTSREPAPYN